MGAKKGPFSDADGDEENQAVRLRWWRDRKWLGGIIRIGRAFAGRGCDCISFEMLLRFTDERYLVDTQVPTL